MSTIISKAFNVILLTIFILIFVGSAHTESTNTTGESEDRAFSSEVGIGRTFGQIKKFQTALLPIMYKLGVMSAVIMMTLFLAFKGVFIGTLILILNLTFFAIKFGSYLKADHIHHGWQAPVINHGHGWPSQKDVHLHIHNGHGKPELSIPYSTLGNAGGWEPHSNNIDAWNTGPYVHSGRQLTVSDRNDLTSYASTIHASTELPTFKPRELIERLDNEPTIVLPEKKHIVTPYKYLSKQTRK